MDNLITALIHFCRGQGTQLKLWDIHFDTRCAHHLVHFLNTTTTTITMTTPNNDTRPTVTSLWIQNCTFLQQQEGDPEGALSILCRFFASQKHAENVSSSLQTVSVKKCQLGNTGIQELLQAFHNNCIVETLDISYNNLTCGQALLDLLRHNTTLQHLIVAGNPLFSHGRHRRNNDDNNNNVILALRRGLLYNRTLASLNLSFCKLQNQDLHQLMVGDGKVEDDDKKHYHHEQKEETFALKEIYLENNQLQGIPAGTSLKQLVQYMAPNLQVLSLDSNPHLGVDGARILAQAFLKSNNNQNDLKLRRLFISCCGLQEQGIDCIVAAIAHNTSLIQLHISGNDDNNNSSSSGSTTTTILLSAHKQQERKRLVQVYTKRNALWTRVVQPLLISPPTTTTLSSLSSSSPSVVTAEQRSPLWAQACVTCAQHHAQHGASAVYALVSEMVGLDFFHD